MWRWLPSVLCNKSSFCVSQRRIFFLQLCGLVFTVHLAIMLLYGLIGWLAQGKDRFAISLHQQGATYVLMPLQKKVEQHSKNSTTMSSHSHKKSNVIDHETYQRKKNARKRASTMSRSKTTASKKSVQTLKKVESIKVGPTKVGSTKAAAQALKAPASLTLASGPRSSKAKKLAKNLSKSKHKKSSMKLQEVVQIEMVQPVEQPVEQSVEQPKIEQQVEQLKVEEPKIEQSMIDQPETQSTASVELEQDDDFDENNVIFVGYEELDQSLIGSKIQHTIQQFWTPPVGMHKNINCEVRVTVGADGHAVDAKIIKESGVFVYDASARKTLINIEYPKEIWNKTITIALGA